MTQRTTHEMKLEIQSLLYQVTQALAEIEAPKVEITEEGTGIITHSRSKYLACVKEVCTAMLEEERTAEIIVSRCV